MLSLSPNTRIYLHVPPTDMRKSFDGLSGLVRSAFGMDPLGGSWFLFLNRRRDRIKILAWDRDGFILVYKRLESGTFENLQSGGTERGKRASFDREVGASFDGLCPSYSSGIHF